MGEFGGWPIDPTHSNVFSRQQAEESDHKWWAVVGRVSEDLLILDVDFYKMDDDVKAEIETGWFGLLDDTRVVKTPSGGVHVYLRTDAELEDLPRTVDAVDLKGDVARGYCLTHPKSEYEVQVDEDPVKVSASLVRELPIFISSEPRGTRETEDPSIDEAEMRSKVAAPCLAEALDDDSDFATRFINAVRHESTETMLIYDLLNRSEYPEGSNKSAPHWLHDTPSKTGTNFRVDEGGETFRCWRHDTTGNAFHLLGVKHDLFECGAWSYEKVDMLPVLKLARKKGYTTQVSCETVKNNGLCPIDCGRRYPLEGVVK